MGSEIDQQVSQIYSESLAVTAVDQIIPKSSSHNTIYQLPSVYRVKVSFVEKHLKIGGLHKSQRSGSLPSISQTLLATCCPKCSCRLWNLVYTGSGIVGGR